MPARLYVIPGSHAGRVGRLLLEHKGIEYRQTDLISVVHRPILRALRFPRATVPALKLDGRRIQGSRDIARELDRLQPDPPLFPSDPAERAAVEQAEAWGDEVLQGVPRRMVFWALKRDRAAVRTYLEGARLGIPVGLAARTARPIVWAAGRLNQADDASVAQDVAELDAHLDHVDDLLAKGVIGGARRNAADLQIAASVRLLMTLDDLRPRIEARPAGRHALAVCPEFPGRVGPVGLA